MKKTLLFLLVFCGTQAFSQKNNPVFSGWFADPEGIIFDNQYWIFPTFSAPYEKQVFLDAFLLTDLLNWNKQAKIMDTAAVKWEQKAKKFLQSGKRQQILPVFRSLRYSKR